MNGLLSNKQKTTHVQATARQQIIDKLTQVMAIKLPKVPQIGWIRTIRETLGMSGAQLGERIELTRNQISILERKEASGTITLNQLQTLAEGVNADLVYVIVPRKTVSEMIEDRAREIATKRFNISQQNMFLEAQQLTAKQQQEAIDRLTKELINIGGKDLWKQYKL